MSELRVIARKLVEGGKGVFAADASPNTLEKRFAYMGIEVKDADTRLKYRLMTVSSPGLGEYIGGVILHDEAIRNEAIRAAVTGGGMLIGIKVDGGAVEMAGFGGEKITEGLDGLRSRFGEYVGLGAKFTKWRAVISVGEGIPTRGCMAANALLMARYAAAAQEAGLVPIVEPEVLMEGTHTLEKCAEVTETLGRIVFDTLREQRVDLGAILYKPNMVVAGKGSSSQPDEYRVASRTVEVMKKVVGMDVPGVVFLSGGMDGKAATARLNEIARAGAGAPWRWSFSFERAIEGPAMDVWSGSDENVEKAQKMLVHRAKMNSLASLGKYTAELERSL